MERRYLIVPGIALVADPHPRHQSRTQAAENRQNHRAGGVHQEDRLHFAAHDSLRTGRHLRQRARRPDGDGPGGIFLMDADTFDVKGHWEIDRGPQHLAYDFWWHLGHDTMVTSEWGTPNMVKNGLNPELLLAGKYGHKLHVWDLRQAPSPAGTRPGRRATDGAGASAGARSQQDLWLRRRRRLPERSLVIDLDVVSRRRRIRQMGDPKSDRDSRPSRPIQKSCRRCCKGFKAVPPLVTDINLSLDDRFLYVSCWGTGEFIQYDVSDPFNPKKTGSVHLGGIVRRAPHPKKPSRRSTAARRWSRSAATASASTSPTRCTRPGTSSSIPMASKSWMVKIDADPEGRNEARRNFFVDFEGCARTKCGWKAATLRRTPTAIRTRMTHAGLTSTTFWLMLLLGAYHGINPGMGWLFAVALGMQEQKGSAVAKSLVPIALGHALAIGIVVMMAAFLGMALPLTALRYPIAALLIGLGIYSLVDTITRDGCACWWVSRSGIMVVPDGVRTRGRFDGGARVARKRYGRGSQRDGRAQPHISRYEPASGIRDRFHTLGYLAVTGLFAWIVYQKLDSHFLERLGSTSTSYGASP